MFVRAFAAQTVDGNDFLDGSTNSNVVAGNPSFSTTGTNDVVLAIIVTERTSGQGSISVVTGVTDTASLTWTKRSRQTVSSFGPSGVFLDIEIWWAIAASPLTNDTITAALSQSGDENFIFTFGVTGTNTSTPWDTNGALPATANNSGNTAPAVSVSTQCTNTFVVAVAASSDALADPPSQAASGSFTLLIQGDNQGGANYHRAAIQYQAVSSAQSGLSAAFASAWNSWLIAADALQGVGTSCPPPQ